MSSPIVDDILELLPQRPPFVMVGELMKADNAVAQTRTTIEPDNIFVDSDGHFTASGLTENIAQTCAAKIGYYNKYILKKPVAIGFIGAIRQMRFYCLPRVGEVIITTVTTLEEVFGMTLVEAESRTDAGVLLCTAQMKIALRNNDDTQQD